LVSASILFFSARGRLYAQPTVAEVPKTAAKTGWWIKVRTDRTQATSISFQIGTKSEDREPWRVWRSSDATEFDVPEKFLQVERLYIDATANPRGKRAWFCLMYKDHGVKNYETDDRIQEDHSQTDSDGECN
jgi:hypothetical protein